MEPFSQNHCQNLKWTSSKSRICPQPYFLSDSSYHSWPSDERWGLCQGFFTLGATSYWAILCGHCRLQLFWVHPFPNLTIDSITDELVSSKSIPYKGKRFFRPSLSSASFCVAQSSVLHSAEKLKRLKEKLLICVLLNMPYTTWRANEHFLFYEWIKSKSWI